jgi:predicted RNA binding protein YcfA (HicA-like mRNA interferase family)
MSHHTKGAHHFLKHPDKPGLRVRKTLASIIEQAGYSPEEFIKLL